MKMGPENPCFGCAVKFPDGVVRAPCCWDLDELTVSYAKYQAYFADKPNVKIVKYIQHRWMGEEVVISMAGPCVNLNEQTGVCLIETDKPLACIDLYPHIDPLCVRTPTHPQHLLYIKPEDVG